MAAAIRVKHADADIELIRGSGGDFIVIADGEQLWHKREMGDGFPEEAAIVAQLAS